MLDVPAQHDLRGRLAVLVGELDGSSGARAGSGRRPGRPGGSTLTPPSGDHAWVAMPSRAWTSRSACCVKNGCSSTWFTRRHDLGRGSIRSSRCCALKFDTPIARARPSASIRSIALYAATVRVELGRHRLVQQVEVDVVEPELAQAAVEAGSASS